MIGNTGTHTVVYTDSYEYAPNVSMVSNELVTFRMLFLRCQMQGYVYNVGSMAYFFTFIFISVALICEYNSIFILLHYFL